jgi:hypothetical protein
MDHVEVGSEGEPLAVGGSVLADDDLVWDPVHLCAADLE